MIIPDQAKHRDYPETEPGEVNIALVGGGPGCKSLITFLETHTLRHIQVNIVGVADPNENGPGLVYARDKGIYTSKDFRDLFDLEDLHLLIEITGSDDILEEIIKSKPRHLKVMGHLSARLFWEVIELQEEKVLCERRLAHSDRLSTIGRMFSYLAHEIRNPLVSIGGFATAILNAPELHPHLKPKARIIIDEVKRLERVLKNMRDYVRPLQPNKAMGNFNKLVTRVFIALEPELKASGVEMRINLDPDVPDSYFDEDLMREALSSFARRLMKFMQPTEKFTIQTEVCWDTIGIYFEESTARIPPGILQNLFNPFSNRHSDDPGLDLAMSKKIIEDHGGQISLASETDSHRKVTIELPIELI
ncbi:MAG: histidine kinase dimerization/phospho-acceptor domain-containing protein [Syntrophobacterales bacterium]|jgi:signal transduction histidine kinase